MGGLERGVAEEAFAGVFGFYYFTVSLYLERARPPRLTLVAL